ncbi:uncharacterized protein K452DRAFT_280213, partial [Aplosporella prunicola CBS 121167]
MAASTSLADLRKSTTKDNVLTQWHISECDQYLQDGSGIVRDLFRSCVIFLQLFLAATQKTEVSRPSYEKLEDNLATLCFWDVDFGVSRGELDRILEETEENRDLTLSVLISLGDFLSHGIAPFIPHLLRVNVPCSSDQAALLDTSQIFTSLSKAKSNNMDWEEPIDGEMDSVEEAFEMLDSKVARFKVLGSILEDPIPTFSTAEKPRTPAFIRDWSAHHYYAEIINARFPLAKPALVEVLGKRNWERFQRIQKIRDENEHKNILAHEIENESKFHDSGLGTSASANSTNGEEMSMYAETILSKRAKYSHKHLPPLPEDGRKGKPFTCEICNRSVSIQRTQAWRKHVFQDILAYTCIFDDCPSDTCFFEDIEAMTAHLGYNHSLSPDWGSLKCPLCFEETESGRTKISLHFARHMEEISLGVLPHIEDSDDESE